MKDYKLVPFIHDKTDMAELREAADWLEGLVEHEYAAWRAIRKQQSEARWEWYALNPDMYNGFAEVELHESACKIIRKKTNAFERPKLFRYSKKEKQDVITPPDDIDDFDDNIDCGDDA